jgi:hypothetical protein
MNLLAISMLLISLNPFPPIPEPHPLQHCGSGRGYMLCMTGYPEPKPSFSNLNIRTADGRGGITEHPELKPCDFARGCLKIMLIDGLGKVTIKKTIQMDSR